MQDIYVLSIIATSATTAQMHCVEDIQVIYIHYTYMLFAVLYLDL